MNPSNLPPQFFVDYKKGEVNELKNLLNNPSVDKDQNKKKDVIKRVIAYMTLGVDVSKLFMEMAKASMTNDIVTKKMVFLYLINYAEDNEFTILAINTFLKDLKNENAKIRGLALRSLCSLKYKSAYDYYANSLYDALKDQSAYVRKTAVMGLLKVYHLNPKLISDKDIDTLYEMIKDSDPLVVTNTLFVLNEILKTEGGIAISNKMIVYLLNRIKDFNEWGQKTILDLVARFVPKDENQLFDILNILEDRLKHSSCAIVLACTKVFINFTKNNEFIYGQVLKRLKDPLITLMTSGDITGNYEISYVILTHIHIILLKGGRDVFAEMYKKYYVKFEEPLYIKKIKLKILIELATPQNYQDILNELEEYTSDVNSNFAKKTIKCIGEIGMRLEPALSSVVLLLKSFINKKVDYVVSQTITVLQNLFRKNPSIVNEFLGTFEPCISVINNDQKGLSALIWIIGEFGEKIENSPYIIESILDNMSDFQSSKIIYSLLLASTKLFFKTPGEMQPVLGRLFEFILKNFNDVDLRDRTYFFYNLMQNDINLAEHIINGDKATLDVIFSEMGGEYLEKIYSQFNTLSVIYQKPEEKFIKSNEVITKEPEKSSPKVIEKKTEEKPQKNNANTDLIGINNNVGNLISLEPTNNNNVIDSNVEVTGGQFGFNLSTNISFEQNEYQQMWKNIQSALKKTTVLSTTDIDLDEFVKYLDSKGIMCMAFGSVNNIIKMFLYSFDVKSNSYFLTEVQIEVLTRNMIYNIKAQNLEKTKNYEDYFLDVFGPLF